MGSGYDAILYGMVHPLYPTRKSCTQCGKDYGPGTRKPKAFAKSKFCSLECCHLAQQSTSRNTLEKIRQRIRPKDGNTECEIWTGEIVGKGYGRTRLNGRKVLVHRIIWEAANGPIAEHLQIDHVCGVKRCCNLDHLRLVTPRENSLAETSNNMAARNARRTKCPLCGGRYSSFPNGVRYCKPCRHATMMKYQRWRRAEKKAGRPGRKRK